jgi:hypothetical protein
VSASGEPSARRTDRSEPSASHRTRKPATWSVDPAAVPGVVTPTRREHPPELVGRQAEFVDRVVERCQRDHVRERHLTREPRAGAQ